jgi:hypothetical protein
VHLGFLFCRAVGVGLRGSSAVSGGKGRLFIAAEAHQRVFVAVVLAVLTANTPATLCPRVLSEAPGHVRITAPRPAQFRPYRPSNAAQQQPELSGFLAA